MLIFVFFFSSRRRHTRYWRDWSSDVCSSDLGKLAKFLKKQNERVLLVAADVYRPAAIKQLQVLGEQVEVPVYAEEGHQDVLGICERALEKAKEEHATYMIIDTAGRLHIDETLMEELRNIKRLTRPQEILLVVDSMIGQDAVNLAKSFNESLSKIGRASC